MLESRPDQPPADDQSHETLEEFKARISIVVAGLRAYANASPEERSEIARMISTDPPRIDNDDTRQQG